MAESKRLVAPQTVVTKPIEKTRLCDWGGASCPPAREDGFCSDAHRQAWLTDERRYDMALDTQFDDHCGDDD